jgi:hypothetical protein
MTSPGQYAWVAARVEMAWRRLISDSRQPAGDRMESYGLGFDVWPGCFGCGIVVESSSAA